MDGFSIHAFPRKARSRAGGLIEQPRFNEGWNGLKNLNVLARMHGLDPQAIVDLRSLIRRLTREEGIAVVISSHQLAEIS